METLFPLLNMMVHPLTAYSLGMEAHVLTIGLLILFILFNLLLFYALYYLCQIMSDYLTR